MFPVTPCPSTAFRGRKIARRRTTVLLDAPSTDRAASSPSTRARNQRMRTRTRTRVLSRCAAVTTAVALALAGAVAPTAAQAAINATPIIHYTFDGLSGATIADVSGNGQDATLRQSGGTVADGILSLPGGARVTTAYVEIPTASLVG